MKDTHIRWAPRVKPGLIRRLYLTDAKGIVDEELIDKVGYALLDRCETIRRVTERRCPHCGEVLDGAFVSGRYRPLSCPSCGWESTWARYHRSYKRRRIHGGRAYQCFLAYLDEFPKCRSPQQKMLAIDRLIHAVHQSTDNLWTLPAGLNLIHGKSVEVIDFLDELAYGDQVPEERSELRAEYLRRMEESEELTRHRFGNTPRGQRRGEALSDGG